MYINILVSFIKKNPIKKSMAIHKYNDSLEVFQRRFGIDIEAKIKINDKIKEAVLIQDKIRSKVKGWDGTKEIRRWRDRKAS